MPLTRPDSKILKDSGIERRSVSDSFAMTGPVRQTILDSQVDTNGYANFLSAGTGLAVDLSATTKAIILTFANGFDENGPIDIGNKINADVVSAWSGLKANATNYLYIDRDATTGGLTYGQTENLPCVYGDTYIKGDGSGKAYSSFDGADGAVAFTDANGNAWTFNGNAQLDTAQKKFGTSSVLLDGTGDYLQDSNLTLHAGENEGGFEISCWFRLNATGANQAVVGSSSSFHVAVRVGTTEKIELALGNGASWTIVGFTGAGVGTTTLTTGTWYKMRLIWDGATYKVYLSNNGAAETEEISVTSSVAFTAETTGIKLGTYSTNYFNGWIDDFSYQVGPQTLGTETPLSTARGGLQENNEHWFDLNSFKMEKWNKSLSQWDEVQRVFVGEAVTDGSSVNSVVNYALKGQYDSGSFDVVGGTKYTKNHNIGLDDVSVKALARQDSSFKWGVMDRQYNTAYFGGSRSLDRLVAILDFDTTTADYIGSIDGQGEDSFGSSSTTGQARLIVKRGW